MKATYKKLFNISYNNKIFCIFLDETNRRTFLEVNEKGEYIYPTLEEFKCLNEVFNNFNPFIVYVIHYMFQEQVIKSSLGVLAAITVINSAGLNLGHYTVKESEREVQVVKECVNLEKKEIEIKDISQLDELLGYKKISIDEVHSAIDYNDKIPPVYKKLIHKFINHLIMEHSSIDLRIFYENIKTIEFFIVDTNYFKECGSKNVRAQYNAETNQIIMIEGTSEEEFYHELSHVLDLYRREIDDKIIYRAPTEGGFALNEAMTNVTASCITTTTTYDKYGAVLEYLRNYVDFSYEIYNQKGIGYLIELLHEKYPSVDINYIVLALDTMQMMEGNRQYIYLDQSQDLMEELFAICKIEMNQSIGNYYEPFTKFAKLLYYTRDRENNEPTLMYDYLERYNALLKNKNSSIELITKEDVIEKCSQYENVCGIVYQPGSVFPFIQNQENSSSKTSFQVMQEDGSLEDINFDYSIEADSYLKYYIKLTCIENYETMGTKEYWEKIAFERNLINMNQYKEIPIYWNGTLLTKECLGNLTIKIGYTSDGTIGFEIQTKQSETIYKSSEELINKSNIVDMETYLLNNTDLEYLELSNVLNQEYLKELIKEDDLFHNILLKDEELYMLPSYQIRLSINGKTSAPLDLGEFYFVIENGNIELCPFHVANEISEKIYLKNVLDYYGILNKNQLEYIFTQEELIEYYQNYINDIALSKSSKR